MTDDGTGMLGDDFEQAVALLQAGHDPSEIARLLKLSDEAVALNLRAIKRAAKHPKAPDHAHP